MLPELNEIEARLIGCLMEKSVTTPDQMPLTLNALINAANQKSSREPVMALSQGDVLRATRALAERSLVRVNENFRNGREKYRQRIFGDSPFVDIKLDKPKFAIVTLLLLRGPQTPGELRARAGRLFKFADNDAVSAAASELVDQDNLPNSLLVQLPRMKGRKDGQFMHQLCGQIDLDAYAAKAAQGPGPSAAQQRIAALEQQVAELQAENAELRQRLG